MGEKKQKSTPRQHAQQRQQQQMGTQRPRVPGSMKDVAQGKVPGETPLRGETSMKTRGTTRPGRPPGEVRIKGKRGNP